MFVAFFPREAALNFLPKNAVVAEIGVAQGGFAREILTRAAPAKLHLIDPWEYQPVDDGGLDSNNVNNDQQDARYSRILEDFAPEIAKGQVEVHRAYSDKAVTTFPDGYFDWIYVDGSHLYEHVKKDLVLYSQKMKPEGLIYGDDHMNAPFYQRMQFGVVQAVREVIRDGEWHFLLLSHLGQFMLCRQPNGQVALDFLTLLLSNFPYCVEISDPGRYEIDMRVVKLKTGTTICYPSF